MHGGSGSSVFVVLRVALAVRTDQLYSSLRKKAKHCHTQILQYIQSVPSKYWYQSSAYLVQASRPGAVTKRVAVVSTTNGATYRAQA